MEKKTAVQKQVGQQKQQQNNPKLNIFCHCSFPRWHCEYPTRQIYKLLCALKYFSMLEILLVVVVSLFIIFTFIIYFQLSFFFTICSHGKRLIWFACAILSLDIMLVLMNLLLLSFRSLQSIYIFKIQNAYVGLMKQDWSK